MTCSELFLASMSRQVLIFFILNRLMSPPPLSNRYDGLKDVRMVPGKGVAFVEFENEIQSGHAMEGLQNFKITPDYPLAVSFAK